MTRLRGTEIGPNFFRHVGGRLALRPSARAFTLPSVGNASYHTIILLQNHETEERIGRPLL